MVSVRERAEGGAKPQREDRGRRARSARPAGATRGSEGGLHSAEPTGPSGPPPRTARRARHSGPFASHGRGQRVGEMANSRQKQATEILAANREIND